MQKVKDIRDKFVELYQKQEFVIDRTGVKVLDIIGESFEADEPYIFGLPNHSYIKREIEWYESQSLNVYDIPGGTPKIWEQVSDKDGFINSNYGWMVFSKENYSQYYNVLNELLNNNYSRRATMIYQRPQMWYEYNKNDMNEFCCTYGTQHFIRNEELITYVIMRSNDSFFGFRNDKAWHEYITKKLYNDLLLNDIKITNYKIIWTSGSLHLYEKQFYLVDHYIKTGEAYIKK